MEEYLDTGKVIEEFEEITIDAGEVQRQVLKKILKENADCEYLLKHGLSGRTDPQSFKSFVPIVNHHDLEPYLQRIIDGTGHHGDASIVTAKPITAISLRYVHSHTIAYCIYFYWCLEVLILHPN